jgi:hypothetical protein
MPKKNQKIETSAVQLLQDISTKIDSVILLLSLQGQDREMKLRILASYQGALSKRTLAKITGLDRHEF